jgi:AcrR family transcriptional regulator
MVRGANYHAIFTLSRFCFPEFLASRMSRINGRMTTRKTSLKDYHHGNLEQALIAAGLAIVEEDGIEALSLRAVARRAKVSHTAPYHHFASKSELLAAVAAAGFDQMVATIRKQAPPGHSNDSFQQLRQVGGGYLAFAVKHPLVFRLMFRPELTCPSKHARLRAAEGNAFGALLAAIVTAQQAGQISGADPRAPAAFAWSTVHGLAMLHLDGVFGETPIGKVPFKKLEAPIHEAIITGLQTHRWP